ncbi:MAG: PadR family transcriptional regulator, regulatory protein PadR [Actinomycetota bacterium]|nr:PadR family transcriptional regulator, regulatory protein PadR [Actinomycetota bacterium]
MRKGVLEYCVLAHLRCGPSYGLEMAAALGRHRWLFTSEGTLYPLLARLRRQGWVETTWRPSDAGPPRRYYGLTAQGEAAVAAFTEVWAPFRAEVDSVLSPVDPASAHRDGPVTDGFEGDER